MSKERRLIPSRTPNNDWLCDCGGEIQFDAAEYAMESEEWLCEDCETVWSIPLETTRVWSDAYQDGVI